MRVQTGASARQPGVKHSDCPCNLQPTHKTILPLRFRCPRLSAGYSLAEVVVAVAIIALVYGVILNCYIQSGLRAQWAGYSLAAQSLATEQIEQVRSGVWDPSWGASSKDEMTNVGRYWPSWTLTTTSSNFTWSGYNTNYLDVPYYGTNWTIATNFVSVTFIPFSDNTSIYIQMIRVDTVWPFYRKGTNYFTNTAAILLAPDNRDLNSPTN